MKVKQVLLLLILSLFLGACSISTCIWFRWNHFMALWNC